MAVYWWISLAVFFLAGVIPVQIACWKFDRVVRSIYEDSLDCWERLGRPTGFFWIPSGVGRYSIITSMSRGRLFNQIVRGETDDLLLPASAQKFFPIIKKLYRYYTVMVWILIVDIVAGIIGNAAGVL